MDIQELSWSRERCWEVSKPTAEFVLPAGAVGSENCSSLQPLLFSVRGTCKAGGGFPMDWRAGTLCSCQALGCVLVSELPVTAAAKCKLLCCPPGAPELGPGRGAVAVGAQLELPAPSFGVTAPPALGKSKLGDCGWLDLLHFQVGLGLE